MVILVLASACGAQQGEPVPADVVAGHYVWGAEVNSFSPCGSGLEYWVDGEPSILQALRERYSALGLPPYEAVFMEARGEVGPVLDCGFCQSYDGSFEVEELVRIDSTGAEECRAETGGARRENGV